ncbi:MAG: hypothetical protein AAB853_04380, partial [Patescibacteria group bacterium]
VDLFGLPGAPSLSPIIAGGFGHYERNEKKKRMEGKERKVESKWDFLENEKRCIRIGIEEV